MSTSDNIQKFPKNRGKTIDISGRTGYNVLDDERNKHSSEPKDYETKLQAK